MLRPSQPSPTPRARCSSSPSPKRISLGIVRPPAEADIVSLEAQSFGVAVSYGGPYCGVLACKEKFMRQMPGRLVGETVDADGKRGYVLTLSTREQHIRREKATSNICTNQALVAMMATIFLTVYGKQGLRELAEHNLAKAAYPRQALLGAASPTAQSSSSTARHASTNSSSSIPATADETNAALLEQKIIGGLPLARWYPELGPNASLWCATELTTRAQMDAAPPAYAHSPAEDLTRALMDISAIEGEELKSVEFVEDYLQLRFGEPLLRLYAWPHVLLPDFPVAFGEPEYRNALCSRSAKRSRRRCWKRTTR